MRHSMPTAHALVPVAAALPVDLVPFALRQQWSAAGVYPDSDLFSAFLAAEHAHPLAVAVADNEASLSYAQLRARSLSLAAVLHDLGVRPGDVLAVNLPNGWRACAADLAAAALGAIVLPYPIGRKRHETRSLLKKSGAKVLICQRMVGETDYAALVDSLRPELPALKHVLLHGSGYQGWADLDHVWEAEPFDHRTIVVDANGPARLIASSGSESEPKLVLYSHNALVGGQSAYLNTLVSDPSAVRALFCVSLASPFGSLATPCVLAALGATLVNLERFDACEALRLVARQRVTHLFAGPNMVDLLLASPLLASQTLDLGSLQVIVSGGSALSHQTLQGVHEKLQCRLVQSYGSADGVACHTELDDADEVAVQTVGRPDPDVVSVLIMDEQGNQVAPGSEGEVWARGPMTPMCYYGAPELNHKYRTADGWVRTGDRALLDPNARLRILGRRADTVLRNGLKINLLEIELLLRTHPAVAAVAVVDREDGSGTSRLHAFLVTHPGRTAPTLDALNQFLLQTVGVERSKLVDALVPLSRLPLAPSGKVDRAVLAQTLGDTVARPVDGRAHSVSAQPIIDLLMGVERAGVLRAAIELGVFDLLEPGTRTVAELAQALGAHPHGVRILLDALAGLGLLEVSAGGANYALNALSRPYLVRASTRYVGGLAKVYSADLMWETFRNFKEAVIAGGSVLPKNLEASNHPYWQEFSSGIANTSRTTAKRLAHILSPWMSQRRSPTILDIACGNGIYGFTLAQTDPSCSVCGVDWPAMQSDCQRMAVEFGVESRSRFIGGNLFEVEVAEQYDLVILSQVLHHFDAETCRALVARARQCLRPNGLIVICDFMLSGVPPASESIQRLFAAQMLGLTEAGDCYSVDFNTRLLVEHGFSAVTVHALKGLPVHCITAEKTVAPARDTQAGSL